MLGWDAECGAAGGTDEDEAAEGEEDTTPSIPRTPSTSSCLVCGFGDTDADTEGDCVLPLWLPPPKGLILLVRRLLAVPPPLPLFAPTLGCVVFVVVVVVVVVVVFVFVVVVADAPPSLRRTSDPPEHCPFPRELRLPLRVPTIYLPRPRPHLYHPLEKKRENVPTDSPANCLDSVKLHFI